MEEFILGQRWISNAEIQLGLGTIVQIDHRTVTLNFVASDETRTYAQQNAPLTRIIYKIGEQVKSVQGEHLEIESIAESGGIISYSGISSDGKSLTLDERQLDHFVQLNRPAERLFSGQIDNNRWFELRYQTSIHQHKLTHSELSGLNGCRTSLIAHQLFIAHEVANRFAPRVLLADEVGLGKTIEAGLIIHHQLLNERAHRVFIIVPESLVHQWLVEMLRRFNLMFSIFDEQRCQAMTDEGNVFLNEQLVLCSLEFISQNETYFQQALAGEWDLLVVDEAHHLQWTPESSSPEYQLIEKLTQSIRGVLLLTATPEQLGIESHFARLRLLDPDRFPNLKSFIAEDEGYRPIAHAMDALLSNESFDESTRQTLREALKEDNEDNIEQALAQLADHDKQSDKNNLGLKKVKENLIEHMLDRHGTGRVLFRNTRATVKGFPGRKVFSHPHTCPIEYQDSLEQFSQSLIEQTLDSTNSDQENFSHLILYPELLYQLASQQLGFNQYWTEIDPRVNWLAEWLLDQRSFDTGELPQKVLVISANAQSAIDLANTLKKRWGIYSAIFHEGMSLIERDRAAAFFADPENGAPVLICSEIGSEGRNFQFAHQMVLFDLPINPDLLEQRIGRLDRIGQSQTVQIHVPFLKSTAQDILFQWYHKGLNAFEQTCPVGHSLYEQVQDTLKSCLMNTTLVKNKNISLHSLISKTKSLHQQLNTALHEGRDKLLEYNSCRQPQADQLKQLAETTDQESELFVYMDKLFDAFGIEHSEHSEHCYILSPGEHMINQFPGLPDDGMTITYDRSIALANEDMQFFTWEHPMVKSAMEMISSSEMGNTAMTMVMHSELPIKLNPGTLLLEFVFVIETTAHEILQANRYLPPSHIHIVVDEQGNNLTNKISHSDIKNSQADEAINTETAQQIIKVKTDSIQTMISMAEDYCLKLTPDILKSARESSQKTLVNEINRLKVLAQVNPNIRTEEIDFYVQQLQSLDKIYDAVSPRLDATRVIIIT